MTREELIEVIRNELWRQVFARNENAETMEYQKQVWDYDWERTLPKAKAMLSALEAAGVRLVPAEATQEMTGAVLEPTASRYEVMKTYSDMIAASPYAQKETGQ
jgi:hypothetical protein